MALAIGLGRDQEVSCVEKKSNVLHSTKHGLYTSLLFCLLSAWYSGVCILLVQLSYGLGAEGHTQNMRPLEKPDLVLRS